MNDAWREHKDVLHVKLHVANSEDRNVRSSYFCTHIKLKVPASREMRNS